ncbi:hypothetical protein L914_06096, partial [Phytophthora nicotianae]
MAARAAIQRCCCILRWRAKAHVLVAPASRQHWPRLGPTGGYRYESGLPETGQLSPWCRLVQTALSPLNN